MFARGPRWCKQGLARPPGWRFRRCLSLSATMAQKQAANSFSNPVYFARFARGVAPRDGQAVGLARRAAHQLRLREPRLALRARHCNAALRAALRAKMRGVAAGSQKMPIRGFGRRGAPAAHAGGGSTALGAATRGEGEDALWIRPTRLNVAPLPDAAMGRGHGGGPGECFGRHVAGPNGASRRAIGEASPKRAIRRKRGKSSNRAAARSGRRRARRRSVWVVVAACGVMAIR